MKKLTLHTDKSLGKDKATGFTLIELLMVIVVLGVVLSVGVPNFFGTVQNGRLTAQTNQALGMIAYARSEAAKRPGTIITLCASTTITDATPSCNSNYWEGGWFIMADLDGDQILDNVKEDANDDGILDPGEDLNGNGVLDSASDELLRLGEPLSGGNTMRTANFTNANYIEFNATGIPDSSGTFVICDARGQTSAKAIVLSVIGHARVAVDNERDDSIGEAGDEIVNNNAGVNVSCPTS